MAEILDPEGVWTSELLALMLPVAIEREAEGVSNYFGATLAAISSLAGGEGVAAFEDGIRAIKEQTRNAARDARGLAPKAEKPARAATDADKMMRVAAKMGLKMDKKPGGKPKRPPPQGTRIHGGGK